MLRKDKTGTDVKMLAEFLSGSASELDSLSNLCTMLVISDANLTMPMEPIAQVLQSALELSQQQQSGDLLVLVTRALALVLEKFLRTAARSAKIGGVLEAAFAAACMHYNISGGDAQPKGKSGEKKNTRRRGSESPEATSSVAQPTLAFDTCREHELGEELLKCAQLGSASAALAPKLLPNAKQLLLCLRIVRNAPSHVTRSAMEYIARMVREGGLAGDAIQHAVDLACDIVETLSATCDFSPDWDALLTSATQLSLVVVRELSMRDNEGARSLLSRVKQQFFRLAARTWQRNPVQQRLNLIVCCTVAVVQPHVSTDDITTESWEWMNGALSLGMSTLTTRRLGNPFTSKQDAEGDGDINEDEGVLANRQWVPEDSKVMILVLLCRLLGMPSSGAMCPVTHKYVAAWRDVADDEYHRYPTSVANAIAEAFFSVSGAEQLTLPSVSRHHVFNLASLTQKNQQTGAQRQAFLQPVPAPGTTVNDNVEWAGVDGCAASPMVLPHLDALLPTIHRLAVSSASHLVPRACPALARHLLYRYFVCRGLSTSAHDVNMYGALVAQFVRAAVPQDSACDRLLGLLRLHRKWADVFVRSGVARALQAAVDDAVPAATAPKKRRCEQEKQRGEAPPEVESAQHVLDAMFAAMATFPESGGAAQQSPIDFVALVSRSSRPGGEDEFFGALRTVESTDSDLVAILSRRVPQEMQLVVDAVQRGLVKNTALHTALLSLVESTLVPALPSKRQSLDFQQCNQSLQVSICSSSRAQLAVCPNGHHLRLHQSVVWKCNKCGRRSSAAALSCRQCNYDMCQGCHAQENPLTFDVSHCATVGEVIRYLRGERLHLQLPLIRSALLEGLGIPNLATFAQRLQAIAAPAVEADHLGDAMLTARTAGAARLSAGMTILQVALRLGHAAASTVPQRALELHMAKPHAVCKCSQEAQALASRSPALRPFGSPGLRSVNKQSPSHTSRHMELLELVSAMDVTLPSTSVIDQLVVDLVEAHAASVFFQGVDGIPRPLYDLLNSHCRTAVSLSVRRDVMKFCAIDCRRHALLHMVAENLRVRGAVSLDLVSAPIPTKFTVHRDSLDTLVTELNQAFDSIPKLRCKVEFTIHGEAGTGDGPTQEVYTEVSHLSEKHTALWYEDPSTSLRVVFPANDAGLQKYFTALGSSFGRAFVDGFTMDVALALPTWECVLVYIRHALREQWQSPQKPDHQREVDLRTSLLHAIATRMDPQLHRNLQAIAKEDNDALEEMDIRFEDDTVVTTATVQSFILQGLERRFGGCASNVEAFVDGLARVLDPTILCIAGAEEMDVVFCGHRSTSEMRLFSEEELRSQVVGAHGYTNSSTEVEQLISILASLDSVQQSHFVEFLTGSPRLPLGGLAGLNRVITIARKELDCGDHTLPSCNTCFLYFKLPPYRTAEIMKERLLVAITEGRRNFSLS